MPDINSFPSVKPSEYAVQDGAMAYAFTAPGGVTCVLDKQSGGYGCSGPIPAAPGGANMVTGTVSGQHRGSPMPPSRSTGRSTRPSALPPNTRLSFRTVSCGTDGVTTAA